MKKLRKSEINRIIKENTALSNEDLINKYFDLIYRECLGSKAERMEDAGWDASDILEQREYEHYMNCYTDILKEMLQERGVDPWKTDVNNTAEGV